MNAVDVAVVALAEHHAVEGSADEVGFDICLGFSIIGGYWSRRHFHAVCFLEFWAMLDLYIWLAVKLPLARNFLLKKVYFTVKNFVEIISLK